MYWTVPPHRGGPPVPALARAAPADGGGKADRPQRRHVRRGRRADDAVLEAAGRLECHPEQVPLRDVVAPHRRPPSEVSPKARPEALAAAVGIVVEPGAASPARAAELVEHPVDDRG